MQNVVYNKLNKSINYTVCYKKNQKIIHVIKMRIIRSIFIVIPSRISILIIWSTLISLSQLVWNICCPLQKNPTNHVKSLVFDRLSFISSCICILFGNTNNKKQYLNVCKIVFEDLFSNLRLGNSDNYRIILLIRSVFFRYQYL